ncbi:hypothetical protein AMAG_17916 [Allomyces macrogynus ATCC 38327]|uniref:Uncharacterized protein n=1 Tax=Allomyces macrogynus (strain ATCC 38327) TaxID=578462 RepID=A0A0L0S1T3_ALLM3|nr:hypothetical protein AMAG_17916 [Allomyces macrogynus ATCC 38327]|eukprot:KNE56375.1 hypothetical protein AMAG_17916 [Allomyces macrogynus ATCC 38327]
MGGGGGGIGQQVARSMQTMDDPWAVRCRVPEAAASSCGPVAVARWERAIPTSVDDVAVHGRHRWRRRRRRVPAVALTHVTVAHLAVTQIPVAQREITIAHFAVPHFAVAEITFAQVALAPIPLAHIAFPHIPVPHFAIAHFARPGRHACSGRVQIEQPW